ncbi:TPA: hypothetical protein H9501_002335 [Listeria monocytogenes]|nr:hypothetical protein [Listeria monocytogenes]
MEAEKQIGGFVTKLDLLERESKLKVEISREIEKVNSKVAGVSSDLSDLKDIVIPLSLSLDQIAKNTERTAVTLDRFASDTTNHLHEHDIALTGIKAESSNTEKKKSGDALVTVSIIGLIGAVVTAIITVAPMLWK